MTGREKNEQAKGERKGNRSKTKLSLRTSVHAKGDASLRPDFGVSFATVQLWVVDTVQRSRSPGARGLGVAYVFRQDPKRAQPLVQK